MGTPGHLKKGARILGEEPDAACRCLKPGGLAEIVGGGLGGLVGAGLTAVVSAGLDARAGSDVPLPSGDLVLVVKDRMAVVAEVRPFRQPKRLAEFTIGADNVELTERRTVLRVRALTVKGELLAFDLPRGYGANKFNAPVGRLLVDQEPFPGP